MRTPTKAGPLLPLGLRVPRGRGARPLSYDEIHIDIDIDTPATNTSFCNIWYNKAKARYREIMGMGIDEAILYKNLTSEDPRHIIPSSGEKDVILLHYKAVIFLRRSLLLLRNLKH